MVAVAYVFVDHARLCYQHPSAHGHLANCLPAALRLRRSDAEVVITFYPDVLPVQAKGVYCWLPIGAGRYVHVILL